MNIKVVGIDLAKHYFQVCVLTDENKIHSNKKVTRARTFVKMGFEIKLIPPQHVKPFVGHQKNNANDA